MNKIATAKIEETVEMELPAGTDVGGYVATLYLGVMPVVGSTVVVDDATAEITFTITQPGTYHVEVARVLSSGEAVASPVASDPVVVAPDVVLPTTMKVLVPKRVSFGVADAATA